MNAPAPDSSNSLSSNLIGDSTSSLSKRPKESELGLLDSIFGAGTQSRILDSIYRWFEARVRANPGCVRRFVCETYREGLTATEIRQRFYSETDNFNLSCAPNARRRGGQISNPFAIRGNVEIQLECSPTAGCAILCGEGNCAICQLSPPPLRDNQFLP